MNKDIRTAKNILLNRNCFGCKHATEIWLLADKEIKCKKTKEVHSMYYTCYKWIKPKSSDVVEEREHYRKKYIRDRESFAKINKLSKKLKEYNESN